MFFYAYSAEGSTDVNLSGGIRYININDVEEISDVDYVTELLKADTSALGAINMIDATIALRSAYKDNYNMHAGPTGIEVTDETPLLGGGLYESLAKNFADLGIKDHFGLNLNEYLELTREKRLTLQRLAVKISEERYRIVNEELQNQLEDKK